MAECNGGCDGCEHCAPPRVHDTEPAPPPSVRGKLLTRERLAFLRGPMGGGRMLTASEACELADAYEEALRLAREAWHVDGINAAQQALEAVGEGNPP